MRKVIALMLVFALFLTFSACRSKNSEDSEPLGLPKYDNGTYEVVDEDHLKIYKVTKDDFLKYIDLLKENGYVFNSPSDETSEETMLKYDFWQGKKDNVNIVVFLMLDTNTLTNYISVSKSVEP